MEEDKKVIEKLLNIFEILRKDDEEGHASAYELQWEDIRTIENLINRNKELEEVVEYFKFCRGNLPKDTLLIVMCNEDFCRNFGNDYISKSKVKEKIKELEQIKQTALTDRTVEMMNDKICILQQLLEES